MWTCLFIFTFFEVLLSNQSWEEDRQHRNYEQKREKKKHNSNWRQLHVRDKIFNVKSECEPHEVFLWGSRTTGKLKYTTQLHNLKTLNFLLKNAVFAFLSAPRPYRRGGVRADKYCPTQTLQEPGRHQHSGNKRLHLQKSSNTATYFKMWLHTYHVPICNGPNYH